MEGFIHRENLTLFKKRIAEPHTQHRVGYALAQQRVDGP
jgi:hypothetical protein